jgi:hypothetical protein
MLNWAGTFVAWATLTPELKMNKAIKRAQRSDFGVLIGLEPAI